MQEILYEHDVSVDQGMLEATLLQFPVIPGLLAVLSTEEMNEIRGWKVTSSKCCRLSQNQFLHSTNIIGLFIKLGKYVSLH